MHCALYSARMCTAVCYIIYNCIVLRNMCVCKYMYMYNVYSLCITISMKDNQGKPLKSMLSLYVTSICYVYMLCLYVMSICYVYMLCLYVTSICYVYMLCKGVNIYLFTELSIKDKVLKNINDKNLSRWSLVA